MIVASLERTGGVFQLTDGRVRYCEGTAAVASRVHRVGINIGRRLNPCHRFWQRAKFRGGSAPLKRQTRKNLCGCAIVQTQPLLTWGGDDGSDQGAHIRPEGGADAEAPRGGTKGSGNPEASGDRRQGGGYTEEEQGLGPL